MERTSSQLVVRVIFKNRYLTCEYHWNQLLWIFCPFESQWLLTKRFIWIFKNCEFEWLKIIHIGIFCICGFLCYRYSRSLRKLWWARDSTQVCMISNFWSINFAADAIYFHRVTCLYLSKWSHQTLSLCNNFQSYKFFCLQLNSDRNIPNQNNTLW